MIVVLAVLLAAPQLLGQAVPDRPRGSIGLYERVSFESSGPEGRALAGIIAPDGWLWLESRDSGRFLSADREASIEVELRPAVADRDALVREGVPSGAALLPAARAPARPGIEALLLEYDLAAGDSPASSAVVCPAGDPPVDCLLIRAAFGSSDEANRDRARADLARIVESAEIVQ